MNTRDPRQTTTHDDERAHALTPRPLSLEAVEIYWRPGCGFCHALRGSLRRARLPLREINIWNDPSAAARVRAVARGNETVPTVFVGDHALVAPTRRAVLALVASEAPHLLPDEPERSRWSLARLGARVGRRHKVRDA